MDDSTAAGRHPTRRWVDAAALLSRLEQAHDEPFYRYAAFAAQPPTPPPDVAARGRNRRLRGERDTTPIELPSTTQHGLRGYRVYGCRCDTCTDAIRDAKRRIRRGHGIRERAA